MSAASDIFAGQCRRQRQSLHACAIRKTEIGNGVLVVDQREPGGYVTPKEITGQDGVFVSRVRVDPTVDNGLSMWVVSDNLRKGAALNAVQIAEELIKGYI